MGQGRISAPCGPSHPCFQSRNSLHEGCSPLYTLCCSGTKSCLTLWPHGLQHARLPCPSPSLRVCSDSCPLSRWYYLTISSSATLFLPSIFPSIRVFSNESTLCIRWPKYWSFNLSIGPSKEYSGHDDQIFHQILFLMFLWGCFWIRFILKSMDFEWSRMLTVMCGGGVHLPSWVSEKNKGLSSPPLDPSKRKSAADCV